MCEASLAALTQSEAICIKQLDVVVSAFQLQVVARHLINGAGGHTPRVSFGSTKAGITPVRRYSQGPYQNTAVDASQHLLELGHGLQRDHD